MTLEHQVSKGSSCLSLLPDTFKIHSGSGNTSLYQASSPPLCPSVNPCPSVANKDLTLLPSSMTTTSCWAYSWISVSHAWRWKERTEWWRNPEYRGNVNDREEGLDMVIREEMDEATENERFIYSLLAAVHCLPLFTDLLSSSICIHQASSICSVVSRLSQKALNCLCGVFGLHDLTFLLYLFPHR